MRELSLLRIGVVDFVIIANSWSAAVDNPTSKHQIAIELARRGHRVLWVEGAGMRRPRISSGSDRGRMVRRIRAAWGGVREARSQVPDDGRIWVLSPLTIPLPGSGWAGRVNGWLVDRSIRRAMTTLGLTDPVLINYVPPFADVMRRFGARAAGTAAPTRRRVRVVYHCVDRWDAFDMYDSAVMTDLDAACCRHADLVIASSRDLYERCRKHNPRTHLVMHGVSHETFRAGLRRAGRRPADLPDGPIMGFFGLVSEWVDQELLVRLAREVPGGHVVIVGKADVPVTRLEGEKNIHLLGGRRFEDVPGYVAWFDVGLIPFVVNDLTRAVNPIKLREMLAAGCPVVSTDLPEVAELRSCRAAERQSGGVHGDGLGGGKEQKAAKEEVSTGQPAVCAERRSLDAEHSSPPAVCVAKDEDEFVRLVKERLSFPLSPQEREALSDSVKGETWEAKVGEILDLIKVKGS